eukprot:TRINITY_DN21038_c0_g1_i2.p1 TRINITY_DN21038_c0_g1~~TRINITY_DN21038_c0_g1_i2.p1  ORF type:complete len:653 (+),score=108.08 TRINITY_DN21038_c0_g1_i2:133-2091(+)
MVPRLQAPPDIWSEYVRKCRLAAEDHVAAQTKLTEGLVGRLNSLQPLQPLLSEQEVLADAKVTSGVLKYVPTRSMLGKQTEDFTPMLSANASSRTEDFDAVTCSLEKPHYHTSLGPNGVVANASKVSRSTGESSTCMYGTQSEPFQAKVAPVFLDRTDLHLEKQHPFFIRSLKKALGEDTVLARLTGNFDNHELDATGIVHRLIRSRLFQVLSASVIAVHTLFIIANTNASMRAAYEESLDVGAKLQPQADWTEWVDAGFMAFYAVELALRLWVYRLYFFFNTEACWNILDVFLVGVSLVGVVKSEQSTNLLAMRSTRILKLARLLRVVRAMRFFKQLQLFVDIILGCCESLFWAVSMILLILLLFAIFFVQMMENWVRANWSPDAREEETRAGVVEMFGSVQAAMLTLSKAVSGGMDWEAAYAIAERTGYVNGLVFLCMVAFFSVAIWNIVASVFIENTIQAASVDREQQVVQEHQSAVADAKELMTLCKLADVDKSGTFSAEEFRDFIESDRIREFFLVRGLDIRNAEHFFEMLNSASEGDELELEYFVGSCLRVKGAATSIDLHMLSFEHKVLAQKMKQFIKFVHQSLNELSSKTDQVLSQVAGVVGHVPDANSGDSPLQGEVKRCYASRQSQPLSQTSSSGSTGLPDS